MFYLSKNNELIFSSFLVLIFIAFLFSTTSVESHTCFRGHDNCSNVCGAPSPHRCSCSRFDTPPITACAQNCSGSVNKCGEIEPGYGYTRGGGCNRWKTVTINVNKRICTRQTGKGQCIKYGTISIPTSETRCSGYAARVSYCINKNSQVLRNYSQDQCFKTCSSSQNICGQKATEKVSPTSSCPTIEAPHFSTCAVTKRVSNSSNVCGVKYFRESYNPNDPILRNIPVIDNVERGVGGLFRIAVGKTVTVITKENTCYVVKNKSTSESLLVPLRTNSELESFEDPKSILSVNKLSLGENRYCDLNNPPSKYEVGCTLISTPEIDSNTKELTLAYKIDSNTTGLTLNNSDNFGHSVSITPNGNTLAVGAYWDDTGVNYAGAVYIFTEKNSEGEFEKPKKISSKTEGLTLKENDRFGKSVSITRDGNTLFVGANENGRGGFGTGIVYVFTQKDSDGNFINPKKIVPNNTTGLTLHNQANFGMSVAITPDGNTLAVGAPGYSVRGRSQGGQIGAVYVFTQKDSGGNFINPKKIVPNIPPNAEVFTLGRGAGFGSSLAITPDGNTLIAGVRVDKEVYVFTQKDSDGNFINPKKIVPNTRDKKHSISTSVSVTSDGNTLAVVTAENNEGGPAYIFTEKDSGGNFINPKKIFTEILNNRTFFGHSISITPNGNTLVVGARGDDTGGPNRGAVYVYKK